MSGGATTGDRRRMLGIALGSPPVVGRRLAVQTRRRVQLLVQPGSLAVGPYLAEPVGGEQQLPDAGEKSSQNPYRDARDTRNARNVPVIPELSGFIRQPLHPYRLHTRTGLSAARAITLRVRALTRHGAA
jgi:hypothetical protein